MMMIVVIVIGDGGGGMTRYDEDDDDDDDDDDNVASLYRDIVSSLTFIRVGLFNFDFDLLLIC